MRLNDATSRILFTGVERRNANRGIWFFGWEIEERLEFRERFSCLVARSTLWLVSSINLAEATSSAAIVTKAF